jgi:hypothetical protein
MGARMISKRHWNLMITGELENDVVISDHHHNAANCLILVSAEGIEPST